MIRSLGFSLKRNIFRPSYHITKPCIQYNTRAFSAKIEDLMDGTEVILSNGESGRIIEKLKSGWWKISVPQGIEDQEKVIVLI